MPAAQQLNLLDSLRTPDAAYAHFKAKGECLHCRLPLRHEVHAFNHWKRHHSPKPKKQPVQYLVWVPTEQRWRQVPKTLWLWAKRDGIATAKTKPVSFSS